MLFSRYIIYAIKTGIPCIVFIRKKQEKPRVDSPFFSQGQTCDKMYPALCSFRPGTFLDKGFHVLATLIRAFFLFIVIAPSFVLSDTFHNFFRAITARLLGDRTPQYEGFLTLNPAVQTDILGTFLALGILTLAIELFSKGPLSFLVGIVFFVVWTSPIRRWVVVPINEQNFKNPILGEVATLLAGPIGSIFYSFLLSFLMRILYMIDFDASSILWIQKVGLSAIRWDALTLSQLTIVGRLFIWEFIDYGSQISVMLALFQLVPVPPLIGGRIIQLLMPPEYEEINDFIGSYGMFIVLSLLFMPVVSPAFMTFLSKVTVGICIAIRKLAFIGVA